VWSQHRNLITRDNFLAKSYQFVTIIAYGWSNKWKGALNAFEIAFDGRLHPERNRPDRVKPLTQTATISV